MKDSIKFHIKLIEEVQKNPQLYNYNGHTDYSDRQKTKNIWAKIGEKFNEPGDKCKTKWKSIRSAYIRNFNSKSKSWSGVRFKKEYYLAAHLQFLNPFIKIRTQEGFSPSNEIQENKQESENSTACNIPTNKIQENKPESENFTAYECKNEHISNTTSDVTSAEEDPLPESKNFTAYECKNEHISNTTSDVTSAEEDPLENYVESSEEGSFVSYARSSTSSVPTTLGKNQLSKADKCAIDYFTLKKKKQKNKQSESQQKDPCKLFLLSLVPHMASMSQKQQLIFQKGVLELIENIKYRQPPTQVTQQPSTSIQHQHDTNE